jgi:CheY-like chemotaxis protein
MATILFVDDEPHFLRPYTRRLELEGHEVKIVERGVIAEEFLRQNRVDIVVQDMMHGYDRIEDEIDRGRNLKSLRDDQWNGLRLYDRLVREFPNQKIIIRTVLSEEEIRQYARSHYPNLNITAPIFTKGSPQDKEFIPTLLDLLKQ